MLQTYFGSNIGKLKAYRINAVKDPNGQVSFKYVDREGRTIATVLGSIDNTNLLTADPFSLEDHVNYVIDDKNFETEKDIENISIDNGEDTVTGVGFEFIGEHLVLETGTSKINYGLEVTSFKDSCFLSGICYQCGYLYSFDVTDECGNSVINGPYYDTIGSIDTSCSANDSVTFYFPEQVYKDSSYYANLAFGTYYIIKKIILLPGLVDY